MAPLITLLAGSIVARIAGWLGVDYVDSWTKAIAVGLAAMFALTGVAHFVPPLRGDLIAIVPPQLPTPGLLGQFHRRVGVSRRRGPVGSGHSGRRSRVPGGADGGHVPGQRLRRPDAQSTHVDDDAATPAHR